VLQNERVLGDFLHDNGPWIVAVLALALGIVNFVRQVRSDPKPDLRAEIGYDEYPEELPGEDGPEEWDGVYVLVTNRGAGQAYDVTVTVVGTDGVPQIRELGTLATDATGRGSFNRAGRVPVQGTAAVAWGHKRKRSSLTIGY